MSTTHSELDLKIEGRHHRIEWALQRFAWALFALLLVLAALGLFGRGGPLSTREAGAGGLEARYERFIRLQSPTTLRLTIAAAGDSVQLRMDPAYWSRMQLQQLSPQPERVTTEPDALVFEFNTQPGARLQLSFEWKPERPGRLEGWLASGESERLELRQFVYP